jgi:signal transduction histidine kinase
MSDELSANLSHSALAASLESGRSEILAAYERRLQETGSLLTGDPATLSHLLAQADEAIAEVAESLRTGRTVTGTGSGALSRQIGIARATAGAHPAEIVRSASELFEVLATAAADYTVAEAGSALPVAVLAINQSVSLRTGEAITSHFGFLLEKLHQARTEERQHLARELHDRVSAGIGIAFRQLELSETVQATDASAAAQHAESAYQALARAMQDIRRVTADMRMTDLFQGLGLGQNLLSYLDSVGADGLATQVTVNGDESRLPSNVRDEVFLTVREAVRNALHHGQAQAVRVRIDISPHELCATIDDDGIGFDPDSPRTSSGTGIPSMKERICLLAGVISVSSKIGQGTHVELRIPLPDSAGPS